MGIAPILQIAYALVGAYRLVGVKHASRNPNQTPSFPRGRGEEQTEVCKIFRIECAALYHLSKI
jgi:hypothetical protein